MCLPAAASGFCVRPACSSPDLVVVTGSTCFAGPLAHLALPARRATRCSRTTTSASPCSYTPTFSSRSRPASALVRLSLSPRPPPATSPDSHPLVSPLRAQATPGAVTVKYARSPTRSRSARARRRSAPRARSRRSSRSSTRASTATCLPTCATTAPRSLVRRRRGCAGGQSWRRGSVRCVLSSRSLAAARSSQTDLVFPRRASTAAGTLRCVLFTRSRSIGSGATSLTPNLARSSASTQGGTTLARTRTASLRRPRTASRYGSTRTRRSRSSSGATSRG